MGMSSAKWCNSFHTVVISDAAQASEQAFLMSLQLARARRWVIMGSTDRPSQAASSGTTLIGRLQGVGGEVWYFGPPSTAHDDDTGLAQSKGKPMKRRRLLAHRQKPKLTSMNAPVEIIALDD